MLTRMEISERLDELAPFVDEYYRLQAAHAALGAPRGSTQTRPPAAFAPSGGGAFSPVGRARRRKRRPA